MPSAISQSERADNRSIYDVAVLGKALDLLEALTGGEELGLTQLSAITNVNKASAFRVLSTLESRGYVVKNPESRKYRPGPKLVALSSSIVAGLDLVQCARPILESIQAEFGETVNLGVMSEGQILYLDMLESRHGLRTAASVGRRDFLHATSLGKVMLAFLPPEETHRILLNEELVQVTPHTIVTVEALERELFAVRARGYALDNEENELGARCVGVPVLNGSRRPVAALSLSGPAWRLSDELIQRIGHRLVRAARDLEQAMGYTNRGGVTAKRRQSRSSTSTSSTTE